MKEQISFCIVINTLVLWTSISYLRLTKYRILGHHIFLNHWHNNNFSWNHDLNCYYFLFQYILIASCVCRFDGKKGRVKAKLDSYPLSGDSYLEWEWDYLRNMKGLANASYNFYNVSRDFSSYLFYRSTPSTLDNVCLGTDISFNNKLWW